MDTKEEITIRIFDIDGDNHTVPADVLIHILQQLQHSVFLIAMDSEGITISERVRPNADFRKKYMLRCSIPVSGSYALPLVLGDSTGDIFAPERINTVAKTLEASLDAIASGSADTFNKLFHSNDCRNRVADTVRSLLPKTGEQWKFGFSRKKSIAKHPEIVLSAIMHKNIQELVRPIPQETVPQNVNGFLHAMDFAKHTITILYPATHRQLECYYEESLEIALVENRRELVQVIGNVVLDDSGNIKEIIDVESIEAVDLSDFIIESIPYKKGCLKPKKHLVFTPFLNDSKQLLCIENSDLGINVYAYTREQLLDELQEQISALWIEYALEDDTNLTSMALELKMQILSTFDEVQQ